MRSRSRGAAVLLPLIIFLSALFGVPTPAQAQQVASLSFTVPTTYANGAPLPAAEIAGFEAQCSSFTPTNGTAGACAIAGASVTGAVTTIALTGTVPGVGGSACFQVRTKGTNGTVSDWTAAKCKTFPPVAPGAPGNVVVAVNITVSVSPVYPVLASGARGSAFVGFVPVGASAGAVVFAYRAKNYCRVDPGVVLWERGVTPVADVAAPCSG